MDPTQTSLNSLTALVSETAVRRSNRQALHAPPSAKQKTQHQPHDFDSMTVEKLERRLNRAVGRAIADFDLIGEGDRILVAISGGKDSWALLHVLNEMRKRAPVRFELVAANIDQGYAGFRQDVIEDFVKGKGYEYHMEYFNTAKLVAEKTEPGSTPCSLCARMRRGLLYGLAEKHGCNKIALGHHLDDFIETSLLNMLFIGRMAAMAPKLISDDGKNVVIRPLVYVAEKEIKAYVKKEFPVVCCQCPIMCGETVHGDYKRRMVKKMIDVLEPAIPGIRHSLIASLGNVQPSHLLDVALHDFSGGADRPSRARSPSAKAPSGPPGPA